MIKRPRTPPVTSTSKAPAGRRPRPDIVHSSLYLPERQIPQCFLARAREALPAVAGAVARIPQRSGTKRSNEAVKGGELEGPDCIVAMTSRQYSDDRAEQARRQRARHD
jgi:hypothetical protein